MFKYKTTAVFFFFIYFFSIYDAKSQLSGIQVSYIQPSGDFGKVFLPSFSYEIYANYKEIDDNFRYGMAVGVTVLNASNDTIVYGEHDQRLYKKTYEFQAGFIMIYNILKNKFTPFVGLDIYIMGEKYNFTQVDPFFFGMDKEIDFGVSATPKIGCTYEFFDDCVFTVGAGYAYRYKIVSDQKENYFKYFISLGYYF